jgi:hypothetical protein
METKSAFNTKTKVCGRCHEEKEWSQFLLRKKKNANNGNVYIFPRKECKVCGYKERREKYANNPDYFKKKVLEYHHKNKQKISEYRKKFRQENLTYIKARAAKNYKKNSEIIKTKRKEYYYANADKVKALNNDYLRRNKAHLRAKQRENHARKRQEDIHYAIMKKLRTRVHGAIKKKGVRCYRTMEVTGCTMAELIRHLESQFNNGMNWTNHGLKGWHIDHIIPLCKFDLTDPEQQKKAFHYTNLQPLWWIDNLKKGGR